MTREIQQISAAWIIVFLAGWGEVDSLWAESVMAQLESTVDRVVEILKDARPQRDTRGGGRRDRLREVIAPRFDFEEMAKRSLGEYWQRYASRKTEFVAAFTNFIEDSYLSKIEAYKNEKILYNRERVDEGFAEVETKVVTGKGDEIPINYRLHSVGGKWKVYDVLIENVSLVNNYRSQFKRILYHASFDELLKRLQEKRSESSAGRVGL